MFLCQFLVHTAADAGNLIYPCRIVFCAFKWGSDSAFETENVFLFIF
jgi:hypothetical protein